MENLTQWHQYIEIEDTLLSSGRWTRLFTTDMLSVLTVISADLFNVGSTQSCYQKEVISQLRSAKDSLNYAFCQEISRTTASTCHVTSISRDTPSILLQYQIRRVDGGHLFFNPKVHFSCVNGVIYLNSFTSFSSTICTNKQTTLRFDDIID